MSPCATLYWFGDAFARRGYVVLAVNVGHRTKSEFYEGGDPYAEANTDAANYNCSDDQDGDGPDNHPLDPITVKRMGPFWTGRTMASAFGTYSKRMNGFGNGRT